MNQHRPTACAAALTSLFVVFPALAASDPLGFVLRVKGTPMVTEASGMTRRAKPLQDIHDGETIALEKGDALTVCDPARGSFEMTGPGIVKLGASANSLAGSPRIVRSGPCEDSVSADGNGGIILRRLGLHGKAQAIVGR